MNVRDDLKHLSVDEIRETQRNLSLPFSVACLNVTKDLNVGMIVRTAAIFGAEQAYILGRRKYDKRTTVGSQHYLPVQRIDCMNGDDLDVDKAISFLLWTNKHTIISVEQSIPGGNNFDILDIPWRDIDNPCLVFGNEGDGIPEDFVRWSDYNAYIPQNSVMRSLNVSNSAAIAIHEAYRNLR